MVEMVDSVIDMLKADAGVNALVGSRIYKIKGSSNTLPFLTVIEAGNREIESSDDEEYADEVIIQVDIWSKTSNLEDYKQAIQKCMRKDGWIHSCGPDDWVDNPGIYHKAIQFTKEIVI